MLKHLHYLEIVGFLIMMGAVVLLFTSDPIAARSSFLLLLVLSVVLCFAGGIILLLGQSLRLKKQRKDLDEVLSNLSNATDGLADVHKSMEETNLLVQRITASFKRLPHRDDT